MKTKQVSITATWLNCRSFPSLEAKKVGLLRKGTVADVIYQAKQWIKVYDANNRSKRYWLWKNWTTPYEPFVTRAWPTDFRTITQKYGVNKEYYSQFGLDGHEGLDIRAPEGSNVYAIEAGRVKMVATNPLPKSRGGHNYGIHIRIAHSDGYESIYAHLSALHVEPWDTVFAGQVIGKAGNTGNSFGAHLHLSIKHNGRFVNPEPFVTKAAMVNAGGGHEELL